MLEEVAWELSKAVEEMSQRGLPLQLLIGEAKEIYHSLVSDIK